MKRMIKRCAGLDVHQATVVACVPIEAYHRFLLSMQLRRVEDAEQYIEQLDQRIAEKLVPYQGAMILLMQIPGSIGWLLPC
jgi:hypothetical protein